jgi:acetyltransferase-like isoleucine patch superfamily enzyme
VVNYLNLYPDKINYYRQEQNIGEPNFEFVLSKGRGRFLKLHNDTLPIRSGSLVELLKVIKATEAEMPVIFMTNGPRNPGRQLDVCNSLDEFVQRVSYISTWIGAFGIWSSQFHAITDFLRNIHLHLVQTDTLLRLMADGRRAIVLYENYFISYIVPKKGGYNVAEIFGKNYLSLLKNYVASGQLSEQTYEAEKKEVFLSHIAPYFFDESNNFDKSSFFLHLKDYWGEEYFYAEIEKHFFKSSEGSKLPTPVRDFPAEWRALNTHNDTTIIQIVGNLDPNKVKVGRKTYGGLTIYGFDISRESLTIGSFVSIAANVTFILGGNHGYDALSTYPFKAQYLQEIEAQTKGPVVIEDDVWIGHGSIILSGVTIGRGSIIAAGSVISKSVSPYSIVGGNPAKFIKLRFDQDVVEKLMEFDFANISDQLIFQKMEVLYKKVTIDNVDQLLSELGHPIVPSDSMNTKIPSE